MRNGRPQLRLDIVANEGNVFLLKSLRPKRVTGDEHGNIVDKGNRGLKRTIRIKPGGPLRPDGQVIQQDLRP